jgi:hypothetical protein
MDNLPTHWPLPPNLRVDEHPGELVITRTWNRMAGYVSLFVGAILGFFLSFDVVGFFLSFDVGGETDWFGLVFKLVAIFGPLYLSLAQLTNQTTITLSFDELAVRHGPLPWPGRRELFRGDVQQLYVMQEHIFNSKSGRSYSYIVRLQELFYYLLAQNTTDSYLYSVCLRVAHQRDLLLVAGLPTAEEAKLIEQKIEEYLKLKDQPVQGEWKGKG